MHYKIADLITQIPAAGDMVPRCEAYLMPYEQAADIIIKEEYYGDRPIEGMTWDQSVYMRSGLYFYRKLLNYDGLMLHASAVALDGKAYLFSGPCGQGKSTHAKLWQQVFGSRAQIINDDKPALRRIENQWYAYGTPWCGKDGINQNKKLPLAGICFLVQSSDNKIRRIDSKEAVGRLLSQTIYRIKNPDTMVILLSLIEKLIQEVPIFELENRPEKAAALLSYQMMCHSEMENRK